ncbi:MAG: tRNA 4-thiouridine(8) synthase ThiI [Candidatus Micrarchaeota archaeon]|nr:tRNA 4-thiouridine(8) synthase ThiI [Candidatus Micrarchaeota archaeon]MDE1848019.1 tRNA 4-thiouridine(8) synthase ThiI [Candidatus Micrarchaeota archaeon]MDE1864604.1 tRNA 4-thiouridine(8) synthase ThiI [Candidatus Micrarchaeota archaeon]
MAALKPEKSILVHFGELWLRGNNRASFIAILRRNICAQLKVPLSSVKVDYDKFLIPVKSEAQAKRIMDGLGYVIGISNYSLTYSTKAGMEEIKKLSAELLAKIKAQKVKSVKISASRSYKQLEFTSRDIVKELVGVALGSGVDPQLDSKESELSVIVYKDKSYISADKRKGINGIPVGSSGRGIVMFSGGIDSPVAAWYAMRRGVAPIYIHLHGLAKNSAVDRSKIPSLLKILSKYSPTAVSYYVPSHIFQLALTKVDNKYEPVLLKAFLFRISEKIAQREGATAIFTGESLGQVASQTIANLSASQQSVELPILRPLIGLGKQEIIDVARQIGTYELSILPYKDVCSINTKNTVTNASKEKIARLLDQMQIAKVVDRSLEASKRLAH